ncbi:MAG: hypothetical protein ACLUSP_02525 [Christensenellales bacterium]
MRVYTGRKPRYRTRFRFRNGGDGVRGVRCVSSGFVGRRGTKTERGCQAIMLAILALGASGLKAGGSIFRTQWDCSRLRA